jgi:hypothetical protein
MQIVRILAALGVTALAVGCAGPKWQVQQTEMLYSRPAEFPGKDTRTKNTVLVNTETGETWLFWPNASKDAAVPYHWVPLSKDAVAPTTVPAPVAP